MKNLKIIYKLIFIITVLFNCYYLSINTFIPYDYNCYSHYTLHNNLNKNTNIPNFNRVNNISNIINNNCYFTNINSCLKNNAKYINKCKNINDFKKNINNINHTNNKLKNNNTKSQFYYTDKVEHLFTHCLIAYPEIAFNKNNYMSKHYSRDCITSSEFIKILQQLYNNNYCLVNINDCFKVENNQVIKCKVKVPVGKKPLILSFDDVNYDQKKLGKGMVDKIILDNNGKIATSTKINGKEVIEYNKEFVCILENFINSHPNFSINNAKGTINITGYDGILGYRTSHHNKINRDSEINKVKKLINVLKNNGWNFASHSFGHYHMKKISLQKFKEDVYFWEQQVESLVGETSIYVYPYGEWEVLNHGEISLKHKALQDSGFKLFCGVGMKTFYSYLPNTNKQVLFMDRKCIDGRTLMQQRKELYPFFNPQTVLDLNLRSNI